MKTYRVIASYVSYCYADIEAENQEEAERIAENMDGGDFNGDHYGGDDWKVEQVKEVEA
jgi:hypothetical protein